MPLNELAVPERVIGEKEVLKALERGTLRKLFVAMDSDPARLTPILRRAEAAGVEIERTDSRVVLGRACAIDRSAMAAGLVCSACGPEGTGS
ncbi:MAG: ribosomal L7Ae/L30e/S12e/Gadd45 family protein [Fretibacterium sp.]|jgi:large subunit ribosomal protein L7A|nr:ribosomal L7Ae/L30e/S12e/Gadd45 family protein [Fretibacterium sp.]